MTEAVDKVRELVDKARNGDRNAFGNLYEIYYDQIYKYIYFRTGLIAEAEDLTMEAFLGAFKSIKNFHWQGSSFASWLFRIANNVVADFWRQRNRAQLESLDDQINLSDGADINKQVFKKMQFEKIQQAYLNYPTSKRRW